MESLSPAISGRSAGESALEAQATPLTSTHSARDTRSEGASHQSRALSPVRVFSFQHVVGTFSFSLTFNLLLFIDV